MGKPRAGVTAKEAAAILTTLRQHERRGRQPVTAAQVRALLVLNTNGRVMNLGKGSVRKHGETRLYGAEDVAIGWVALRLRDEGMKATVARLIPNCWRPQLIEVWRDDDPMVLAVFGIRVLLLAEGATRSPNATAWVPLRPIWRAVTRAVERTCASTPTVTRWKAAVSRMLPVEAML